MSLNGSRRSSSPLSMISEVALQDEIIEIKIFIPALGVQKSVPVSLTDTIWSLKQNLLSSLSEPLSESFNYGLFLPPCNGRAGKFLLDDRVLCDYPFQERTPYLELKYKKRVYKSFNTDAKVYKRLHSKQSLRKFCGNVHEREVKKVEELCQLGLDPNFHDINGETPLTLACSTEDNRDLILALVSGGAHLDFRNLKGQTPLHQAVFNKTSNNVKCLLDLGASTRSRDQCSLSPLYYACSRSTNNADIAELLLRDFSEMGSMDAQGNAEIHQACRNGLNKHLEHLLFYGADVNCQNHAGNTPLHISVINMQIECAKLLLFRSADVSVYNNSGQTPYHIAIRLGLKELIQLFTTHDPQKAVPYRSQPRYNSKRRLTLSRTFLSRPGKRSSICSPDSQCSIYDVNFQHTNSPVMVKVAISEASSLDNTRNRKTGFSSAGLEFSGYDATSFAVDRRFSQPIQFDQRITNDFSLKTHNDIQKSIDGRTIVIQRASDGFGFLLRGAGKVCPDYRIEPNNETPSLQFFESVQPQGMAAKAGLEAGDFLLEVNGIDVRRWTHDEVTKLIAACTDFVAVKVATMEKIYDRPNSEDSCATLNSLNKELRYIGSAQTIGRTSNISLPAAYRDPRCKVASVKNRPTSRRISATELETLMIQRDVTSANNIQQSDLCNESEHDCLSPEQPFNTAPSPRVYNSVAEMKRLKVVTGRPKSSDESACPSPAIDSTDHAVKQQFSSPESPSFDPIDPSPSLDFNSRLPQDANVTNNVRYVVAPVQETRSAQLTQIAENSSNVIRKTSVRPKTPPPPPPAPKSNGANRLDVKKVLKELEDSFSTKSITDKLDNMRHPKDTQRNHSGFSSNESMHLHHVEKEEISNDDNMIRRTNTAFDLPQLKTNHSDVSSDEVFHSDRSKHMVGLPGTTAKVKDDLSGATPSHKCNEMKHNSNEPLKHNASNLEETPAKFGSTLCVVEENFVRIFPSDRMTVNKTPNQQPFIKASSTHISKANNGTDAAVSSENIDKKVDTPKKVSSTEKSKQSGNKNGGIGCGAIDFATDLQNALQKRRQKFFLRGTQNILSHNQSSISSSETNRQMRTAFASDALSVDVEVVESRAQKDSGYTSSRNSLEKAEIDTRADALTSTSSFGEATAGYLDSENASNNDKNLKSNPVDTWTPNDVAKWLDSLSLGEYKSSFSEALVGGSQLSKLSRTDFARLGVTRVAHRLAIEDALKSHKLASLK